MAAKSTTPKKSAAPRDPLQITKPVARTTRQGSATKRLSISSSDMDWPSISRTSSDSSESDDRIKVSLRVRPFLDESRLCAMQVLSATEISIALTKDKPPTSMLFDQVFQSFDQTQPQFSTNEDVFKTIGAPLVCDTLNGYNGCLLAYGGTGSGKTYSMLGTDSDPGLIPRIVRDLTRHKAQLAENTASETKLNLAASFIELYNESFHDLITQQPLELGEVGLYVKDDRSQTMEQWAFDDFDSFERKLGFAFENRRTTATNANEHSSRSHAIVLLRVEIRLDAKSSCHSTVFLVDLAGSENAERSGSAADANRLREAKHINQSNLTLNRCLTLLADRTAKTKAVIPYNDSKLTRLLRNALEGNCQTFFLAAVAPEAALGVVTNNTVRLADSIKKIQLRPQANVEVAVDEDTLLELARLKAQLEELKSTPRPTTVNKQTMAEFEQRIQAINDRSRDEREALAAALEERRQRDILEMRSQHDKEREAMAERLEQAERAKLHVESMAQSRQGANDELRRDNERLSREKAELAEELGRLKLRLQQAEADADSAARLRNQLLEEQGQVRLLKELHAQANAGIWERMAEHVQKTSAAETRAREAMAAKEADHALTVAEMEGQVEQLRRAMESAVATHVQQMAAIEASLRDALVAKETELEAVKAALAVEQRANSALRATDAALRAELATDKQSVRTLQAAEASLRTEVASDKDSIRAMQSLEADLRAELEHQRQCGDQLETELAAERQEVARLQAGCDQIVTICQALKSR